MKISRLLAGTALAVCMTTGAQSAPVIGSLAVVLVGISHAPPGSIGLGTSFSVALSGTAGGTGDFSPIGFLSPVITAPFTSSVATPFSFDASFGDFTGTITFASATGPATSRVVTLYALGSFIPDPSFPGGPFTPGPASVTLSLTQTGSTSTVSGSFTLSSPPTPPPTTGVPEPLSLALFGLGLAGLGVAMRRKD